MESPHCLKRTARPGTNCKEYKSRRICIVWTYFRKPILAITSSIPKFGDGATYAPKTPNTRNQGLKDCRATHTPPEELPVLLLEPDMVAMEHISSVNDMVTTGNEPFSVKLPLFKCISTTLTPWEIKGASDSKSYFTTSSSMPSSLLFSIIANLF